MRIEERMVRREIEDIIEIGELLEKFWKGSAGTIVLAMIRQLTLEATQYSKEQDVNADIRFGRIKGLEDLKIAIENAIYEKDQLLKPSEREE